MAEGNNVVGALEIQVAIDSANAYAGLVPLEEKLSSTAKSADQMGTALEAGMQKIAAGAKGADEATRGVTRNLETMLQRQIALMGAGEKGTVDYIRTLAQLRGADLTKLEPLLAQFEQLTEKTKAAAKATKDLADQQSFLAGLKVQTDSLGKSKADLLEMQAAMLGVSAQAAPMVAKMREAEQSMAGLGRSAKDTALAMRFVAPQITDIFTSLASGQNAAVVFLQQGGQLKDMFGGIGNAARATAAYLASMINPLTVGAAAIAVLALAYHQGASEAEAFRKSLILSGNAAGATVSNLTGVARSISSVVGTQHNAAAAVAELAASTKISVSALGALGEAAVRMERVIGQSFSETRKQFEELAKSPFESAVKLNEQYNILTGSVLRQIKSLEDQGKSAQAAATAQTEFANAMNQRMKTLEASLGTVERAWIAVKDAAKAGWDAILNVGREKATVDQLAAARSELQRLQVSRGRNGEGLLGRTLNARDDANIASQKLLIESLEEQIRIEGRLAGAEAQRATSAAATAEVLKLQEKYMSDQAKMAKEIAQATDSFRRSGMLNEPGGQAALDKIIAKIKESYNKGGGKVKVEGLSEYESLLKSLAKITEDLDAKEQNLTKTQQALNAAVDSGAFGKMSAAMQADVLAAAEIAQRREELAQTEKDALELAKKRSEERKREYEDIDKFVEKEEERAKASADAAEKELRAARDKIGAESKLGSEIQKNIILRLEEEKWKVTEDSPRMREIEREIKARKELSIVLRGGEAQQANEEAAKKAAADWERTADQVSQSLSNAIMNGGKSAGEYIRNFFKSMVLTPTLKAIISPLTLGLGGALGFGSASASTGGSSAGGALGLANIVSGFNNGYDQLFAQFAKSSVGSWLGLSSSIPAQTITEVIGGQTITSELTKSISYVNEFGTAVGEALPYVASLASLADGKVATAALSAIGTYIAGPIGTFAGTVLGSFLDGGGGGPKGGGSFSTTGERLFTPADYDPLVNAIGDVVVRNANTLATSFGGKTAGSTISLGFDTDPYGSAENRIASRVISALGVTTLDNSAGRNIGRDPKDITTELATESKRVLLAALQAADLQNGFAEILGRLDPATASPDAIDNLIALAQALKAFGQSMEGMPGSIGRLAELSATAVEHLANASGGMERLQANLAAYYENFFSPQEQQQTLTRKLSKELNDAGVGVDLSLPTAEIAAFYRNLVEGAQVTKDSTEAERNRYALLLSLADPLSKWIDATDALAKAAADAADKLEKQRLTTEKQGLQDQIDSMTSTWGDLAKTLDELENPLETVADKFLRLGTEIKDLQDVLLEVLGGAPQTLSQQLRTAGQDRSQLIGVRGNIRDEINSTILQGFIDRGDQAGALAFTGSMKTWLTEHLSENPTDYAARIIQIIQREAKIKTDFAKADAQKAIDDAKDLAKLEKESREERKKGLRDEIARLKDLASVLDDLNSTILELKSGDLSALPPYLQMTAQGENYADVLRRAQGGDLKALQQISKSGTSYLTEARSFYGSGGDYSSIFGTVTGDLKGLADGLANVPTQLELAQSQLDDLDKIKDAVVDGGTTLIDYSADTVDALGDLGTAIDGLIDEKNTSIDNLVIAINNDIADRVLERTTMGPKWTKAMEDVGTMKTKIETIETAISNIENKVNLMSA